MLSLLAVSATAFAGTDVATELPTVVVTGTRSDKSIEDTPVRTEVVTRKEIDRTNARTLKDALENLPGVQIDQVHGKSGYEVSMQGLTSDQGAGADRWAAHHGQHRLHRWT